MAPSLGGVSALKEYESRSRYREAGNPNGAIWESHSLFYNSYKNWLRKSHYHHLHAFPGSTPGYLPLYCFYKKLLYLVERKSKRRSDRDRERCCIHWLIFQMAQWPALNRVEARSPNTGSISMASQGISTKLGWKPRGWGSNEHSSMSYRCCELCLMHCTTVPVPM